MAASADESPHLTTLKIYRRRPAMSIAPRGRHLNQRHTPLFLKIPFNRRLFADISNARYPPYRPPPRFLQIPHFQID